MDLDLDLAKERTRSFLDPCSRTSVEEENRASRTTVQKRLGAGMEEKQTFKSGESGLVLLRILQRSTDYENAAYQECYAHGS